MAIIIPRLFVLGEGVSWGLGGGREGGLRVDDVLRHCCWWWLWLRFVE